MDRVSRERTSAHACAQVIASEDTSEHFKLHQHLQPLAIKQMKQLKRRTARAFSANLPLPHGRQARIEHGGQHRLAQLIALAQRLNIRARINRNRFQAKRRILIHLPLSDKACIVQISRAFVNYIKNAAFGFLFSGHDKSPQTPWQRLHRSTATRSMTSNF